MGELQLNSLILVVTEVSAHRGGRPLGLGWCQPLRRPPKPWGLGWALQLFRPLEKI